MAHKISTTLNKTKLDWIVILKTESVSDTEKEYGVVYPPSDWTGKVPQTIIMTMADDFRNDPDEMRFIQPEMAAAIEQAGIKLSNVKAVIEQQYNPPAAAKYERAEQAALETILNERE